MGKPESHPKQEHDPWLKGVVGSGSARRPSSGAAARGDGAEQGGHPGAEGTISWDTIPIVSRLIRHVTRLESCPTRYQLAGSHGQRLRNFEIRVTSLRRRPSPPPPLSLSRPQDTIVSEPLRRVGLMIADLRVFG